ncbi:DUF998 domain-containing protein [Marisediminicola sp. LYQ134]|uniref:DUF998 domain-containing protein n=1 Tax=Marisediminicola sp. LYQ134 TaxID=3391061 RepID=UPI0039832276
MLSEHVRNSSMQGRAATAGSALVVLALAVIWSARSTVNRSLYVSELGADGEPTAGWFAFALFLLVVGAASIAWAGRDIRSTAPLLRRWTPSASLGIAAAFFYLASRVPCTSGCPLPLGDTFTLQDLVHTLAAVLAFAMACVAMLQASCAVGFPRLRRMSLGAAISVALIASTGGMLSLLRFGTDIGGMLELVATTIAIAWLAVYGGSIARSRLPHGASPGPDTSARRPIESPHVPALGVQAGRQR